MNREKIRAMIVRAIIARISQDNIYTTFRVEDGKLHVKCEQGLLSQRQAQLIQSYRDAIIAYLTTPPTVQGKCMHGHAVEWMCTKYGQWVCACYENPQPLEFVKPSETRDYWRVTA